MAMRHTPLNFMLWSGPVFSAWIAYFFHCISVLFRGLARREAFRAVALYTACPLALFSFRFSGRFSPVHVHVRSISLW